MAVRPFKADIDRAIRKCWPVVKKDGSVCLTASEFDRRIDRIMAYISTSTSRQTVGTRDANSWPVAGPEMRKYLVDRLSPQWAVITEDEPPPTVRVDKPALPILKTATVRPKLVDDYMRGPVAPLKWKSVL